MCYHVMREGSICVGSRYDMSYVLLLNLIKDASVGKVGPRHARNGRCPQCGKSVIVGLDGDFCAFTVRADPVPLTPFGEALARLGGLATYRLTRVNGRFLLTHREPWHIRDRTPLGLGDVVAEHRYSGDPPPEAVRASVFVPVARETPDPAEAAECPF